ncbi:hypothetical protein ACFWRZ_09170 [Streptomyces rubiginosohelvolus]|uniref:hypothetical protein n=1 Tax=Streptomyces rubiginosohelvolus TaxID=67362 RepID=UPI0036552CC7
MKWCRIRRAKASAPATDTATRWRTELRQQSRTFLEELRLPAVTSVRDLAPFVEARTGRPVMLIPVAHDEMPEVLDAQAPCGMWLATDTADHIFYDADTSPAHADVIIGHEFAHMLRGHRDQGSPVGDLGGLVPDLDPAVIRMLLGRTKYTEPDEHEAEMLGSLLQEHASSRRTNAEPDDPIARTLLR